MTARVVAVDVGGTGVRAGLYVAGGWRARSPALRRTLSRDRLLARIDGAVDTVAPVDVAAVVVAIPSFVHFGRDDRRLSMQELEGADLTDALGRARDVPVGVVPDLVAAVVKEHRHGTGQGVGRFVCVALGTGANAAAIVDGTVVETAFGCSATPSRSSSSRTARCPCGVPAPRVGAPGFGVARRRALGLPDGRAVIEAARDGNAEATALLERAGTGLGRAIATWSALLAPASRGRGRSGGRGRAAARAGAPRAPAGRRAGHRPRRRRRPRGPGRRGDSWAPASFALDRSTRPVA